MNEHATAEAGAAGVKDAPPLVAVFGAPNSGKSTLFNALTGANVRVGNYPGVTVGPSARALTLPDGKELSLIDLPGVYSLAARSPDEQVAVRVLLGLTERPPAMVLAVVDTPRLLRCLYLVLQLMDWRIPMVVALNMMDEARRLQMQPDLNVLQDTFGVQFVPVVAATGEGLTDLQLAISTCLSEGVAPECPQEWPDLLNRDIRELVAAWPSEAEVPGQTESERRALAIWALLSSDDGAVNWPEMDVPVEHLRSILVRAEDEGRDMQVELIGSRYVWLDAREAAFVHSSGDPGQVHISERIDRVLLHPLWGTLAFLSVMGLVFTALFSWADPVMAGIEWLIGGMAQGLEAAFVIAENQWGAGGDGLHLLQSLLIDGVLAGVGAVIVFIPQIALLSLFLALLEDSGYLARASHIMDRVLRAAGLPGKAFVPLLSGYACAVPAVMATRTLSRFRDRLLAIMVIPMTSCSARLPVYTLLIGALFPASVSWWLFPVRPTALLLIYLFSIVVTVGAAIVLGKTLLPDQATPVVLELPPYRWPKWRVVLRQTWRGTREFLHGAGRIILLASIVLWAALSFPRVDIQDSLGVEEVARLEAQNVDLAHLEQQLLLQNSYGGRLGKAIEPVIEPLGYDWQIGIGLLGAFAAREVFVSTMGVVHGVGEADEADTALRDQIRSAKRADGRPVYTPLVGLSLLVFFALAMQCMSTLAVIKKETNSWKWPGFVFVYLTALAWICAFLVYQGGRILGYS